MTKMLNAEPVPVVVVGVSAVVEGVVTVSTTAPPLPPPHRPQLARHSVSMCALFAPVHSPIAFHPSQCVDLSTHVPPLVVSARQC